MADCFVGACIETPTTLTELQTVQLTTSTVLQSGCRLYVASPPPFDEVTPMTSSMTPPGATDDVTYGVPRVTSLSPSWHRHVTGQFPSSCSTVLPACDDPPLLFVDPGCSSGLPPTPPDSVSSSPGLVSTVSPPPPPYPGAVVYPGGGVLTPVTRRARATHRGCTTIKYNLKNNSSPDDLELRRKHYCDWPGT